MTTITLSVREHKDLLILCGLGCGLVGAIILSLGIGAVPIALPEVLTILLKKVGFHTSSEPDVVHEMVLLGIRLPRLLMTVLIGGVLGLCGSALQGLFRNPLVEPGLIGVSGGAAAAVVIFIVYGGMLALPKDGILYQSMLPLVAFGGGLLATLAVLQLSRHDGRTHIAMLILIGVAINALAAAIMGIAIFHADDNQLRMFTFWTLGDLGGASWEKLMITSPLLLITTIFMLRYSHTLNAIALGEAEAYHSGVNVERMKMHIILLSALGVGTCVSLAGVIGFVGLVVPHLIRTCFHADNTLVLPASVLGGALLLLLSDLLSRTVALPAELPIGVVTAFVGAPFFIGLLIRAKRRQEV